MANSSILKGQLQIDHERGVIYFHADAALVKNGYCPTPLRICGLGNIDYPVGDRQIDITIYGPATVNGVKLAKVQK